MFKIAHHDEVSLQKQRTSPDRKQAPAPGWRLAMLAVGGGSNAAGNQKNDNDQENQSYSSGWVIAPVPAMRPSWQRAQEH
jgi:hypothetical protein